MYGRVDLSKVEYQLDKDIIHHHPTYEEASRVYDAYCKYKMQNSAYQSMPVCFCRLASTDMH